jgi:hypothetical protein
MHTVRLYNNPEDAEVRPARKTSQSVPVDRSFDYATWHARSRGATANRPDASSPASAYLLDYATWHSQLQPANLSAPAQYPDASLVDFVTPAELETPGQQAA